MRPIERIKIFLDKVDWGQLKDRWGIGTLIINPDTIKTEWYKNPDQRIGQLLINLGLVYDTIDIWMDSEEKILKDQGVEPREFLFWTSMYDEKENLRDKPVTKLIKDLDTNHIRNIKAWAYNHHVNLPYMYKETFNKELELRSS